MKLGRPPVGIAHVDRLEGSEELKERLRVLLATITGEMSVEEACATLAVGPSRLHEMRREALQAALEGLEPHRAGRPPTMKGIRTDRESELEQKVRDLERDLQGALVRTEIALAMPHLFKKDTKKNFKRRKATSRS
jgi:hypothetical protein